LCFGLGSVAHRLSSFRFDSLIYSSDGLLSIQNDNCAVLDRTLYCRMIASSRQLSRQSSTTSQQVIASNLVNNGISTKPCRGQQAGQQMTQSSAGVGYKRFDRRNMTRQANKLDEESNRHIRHNAAHNASRYTIRTIQRMPPSCIEAVPRTIRALING
jgi:hypothetical protein